MMNSLCDMINSVMCLEVAFHWSDPNGIRVRIYEYVEVFLVVRDLTEDYVFHTPTGNIGKRNWSTYEPWHGISNNVVCVTSKASDQPAHTRSLIRAFASRLNILRVLSY